VQAQEVIDAQLIALYVAAIVGVAQVENAMFPQRRPPQNAVRYTVPP
jgi:hypothetical protein